MPFDNTPDDDLNDQIARTQNLIKLTRHVFKDYCAEHEVAIENAGATNPINFCTWWAQRADHISEEQINDLCNEADSDRVAFATLQDIVNSPVGANQMAGIWPQVTLAFRGEPQHELESMHVIVLLKWKDGRVAPLSAYIPWELSGPESLLDDGNVCTLIQTQAQGLMEIVLSQGLDYIHDHRSQLADDESYEMLMGLIVHLLRGAKILVPGQQEMQYLQDGLRPTIQNVQRILQGMFRPPIPPQMQQAIQEVRNERAVQQRGTQPQPQAQPRIEGGWGD